MADSDQRPLPFNAATTFAEAAAEGHALAQANASRASKLIARSYAAVVESRAAIRESRALLRRVNPKTR
ncbi:MAG TPA: hypothetical protein VJR47_19295 [Stellaceae bacterium]|nr:hypothetical protein [Stellaceae bacterium]